jgi:hypothetical protein
MTYSQKLTGIYSYIVVQLIMWTVLRMVRKVQYIYTEAILEVVNHTEIYICPAELSLIHCSRVVEVPLILTAGLLTVRLHTAVILI